jgi:hypothetical protein
MDALKERMRAFGYGMDTKVVGLGTVSVGEPSFAPVERVNKVRKRGLGQARAPPICLSVLVAVGGACFVFHRHLSLLHASVQFCADRFVALPSETRMAIVNVRTWWHAGGGERNCGRVGGCALDSNEATVIREPTTIINPNPL